MITSRALLRYAGPVALSSLGSVAVGFTDTLIIGRYSTSALAGVGLGASIYELPVHALFGGLMAFKILQPRFASASETPRSPEGLWITLRGLAPWAGTGALGLVVAAALMMQLSSGDSRSVPFQAGAYLLGRAPSLVLEVLVSAFSVTLVSWGRVRVPLVVFVVTSSVNLLLDVPLVYGVGVLPPLGAFGDGLASTVGVGMAVPWLALAVHRMSLADETHEAAHRFAGWRKTTLPAVGSAALDYAGNIVFTGLIAVGGISGLAGARIATASHLLAFALVASLASAALYLLGASYDTDRFVALRLRNSLRVRFVWLSSALGAGVAALSWPFAILSTADPDVRRTATVLGLVVAAACPLIGWTYSNVAVLRAIEKTGSDFVSNVIAVWGAQIPLAVAGLTVWGAPGAFAGLIGYWLCRGMLTHRQVRRAAHAAQLSGTSKPDVSHD